MDDLKIGCLAGLLRLLHDLPEHRLLGIFREKHRQHDAHRLRAGAGQIVYRNLYGKSAHIFRRPGNGVRGNHKNLVLSQLQGAAVLANAGSHQHFRAGALELTHDRSLQNALRHFSYFHPILRICHTMPFGAAPDFPPETALCHHLSP